MFTKKLSKVKTLGLWAIGAVVSREAEKVLLPSPWVESEIRVRLPQRWIRELLCEKVFEIYSSKEAATFWIFPTSVHER